MVGDQPGEDRSAAQQAEDHRQDTAEGGADAHRKRSQQPPAEKAQIQQKHLPLPPAHQPAAEQDALEGVKLRIVDQQIHGKPVAVPGEHGGNDKQGKPEGQQKTHQQQQDQQREKAAEAVQQVPEAGLLLPQRVHREQGKPGGNDAAKQIQNMADQIVGQGRVKRLQVTDGVFIPPGQDIFHIGIGVGFREIAEQHRRGQRRQDTGDKKIQQPLVIRLRHGAAKPLARVSLDGVAVKHAITSREKISRVIISPLCGKVKQFSRLRRKKRLTIQEAGAIIIKRSRDARVVELADSLDSGSSAHSGRAGSSPASRTIKVPKIA